MSAKKNVLSRAMLVLAGDGAATIRMQPNSFAIVEW